MSRSPSYPSISLERAVSLVGKVYEGAQRSQVSAETAVQLMGFKGKSGASLTTLAAVKHFGLIDGRGDALRVTELAMRILTPLNDRERKDALKEAALSPDLFRELCEEFGSSLPALSVIKAIAVRKHEFSDAGAENVAETYLETMRFLEQFGVVRDVREPPLAEGAKGSANDSSGISAAQAEPRKGELKEAAGPVEELELRVSKDVKAFIRLAGPVTGKDVDRLIEILSVLKSSYTDEKEGG